MESHKVEVYIYDLSLGMASHLSPMLIGKRNSYRKTFFDLEVRNFFTTY